MRIAFIVPGRFHAFDLARALRARGHDAVVFTNYPRWSAARFGLPRRALRSFPLHGVLVRLAWAAHQRWGWPFPEAWLNTFFGRWAVRRLRRERWDVVHPWSALAEEVLNAYRHEDVQIYLMRCSTHIRVQARLLYEEEARTGVVLDKPSPWMIERELREYALAPQIMVLSEFAEQSFLAEGVPAARLQRLRPAAPVERFAPSAETVNARCARILSGAPLQVLYVGSLTYRKGLYDLEHIIQYLPPGRFRFRLVGPVTREAQPLRERLATHAEFVGAKPERELPTWYAASDIFIFPTIEDGYALVLAQAAVSQLPILASQNSAAPDLAAGSPAIWTFPIRSPEAYMTQLLWFDAHREELVGRIRAIAQRPPRTWADVAVDFEEVVKKD